MNRDEILIIQYPFRMSQQRVDTLREQILKQKETGVILLSDFCTVVTKPKDIDIQVELEEEGPTPWDFVDNNMYSPFDSQGKERLLFYTECGITIGEHYDPMYQYCPYCGKRHYFEKRGE